jgi:hypothetical protein
MPDTDSCALNECIIAESLIEARLVPASRLVGSDFAISFERLAAIHHRTARKVVFSASSNDTKYSPAECIDCKPIAITGRPDPKHISTSYIERQSLTMRMGMRRFTRLTNAFSKKLENHRWAVALALGFTLRGRHGRKVTRNLWAEALPC